MGNHSNGFDQFFCNLAHASRNGETIQVGGGSFDAKALYESMKAVNETLKYGRLAYANFQGGGVGLGTIFKIMEEKDSKI